MMKKFFDLITGAEETRRAKDLNKRVEKLPQDYKEAWIEMQSHFWVTSTEAKVKELLTIMEDVMTFLEESAEIGTPLEDVLGTDIGQFVEDLVGGKAGHGDYRDKWRKQLNDSVHSKLRKLEEGK